MKKSIAYKDATDTNIMTSPSPVKKKTILQYTDNKQKKASDMVPLKAFQLPPLIKVEPTPRKKKVFSIFKSKYNVVSSLGEGNTSKVYLSEDVDDPKKKIAIKILRDEFLKRHHDSIKSVEQEIQILDALKHQNIISILGYGSDGHVLKPSGREINNIVYIYLEYIPGGLLFDFCQQMGAMGEDAGRFFMHQMIDALIYIQGKGIAHRDLKLENILITNDLILKIVDFGFATYKKVETLKSYRGTKTYMAPEIKEGQVYNGKEIDIFSTGVILFIIVLGVFPFTEAKKSEYFYNLLLQGENQKYWKKTGGENLSENFKDLMRKLFSHNGKERPTIQELQNHPWMTQEYDIKSTKQILLSKYNDKKSAITSASSKD